MERPASSLAATAVVVIVASWTSRANAHHEALFGPQASLAVESAGFVSLQAHEHVFGTGSSLDRETAYITSAGVAPIRGIPWSVTLVQSFTYENAVSPQGDRTGPLSSCHSCFEMENVLLSTSYRIDFAGLNRSTGKDGNFALVSGSLEPPTGTKDYAPFHGPVNGIFAAMVGFEWSHYAMVGLGYYRLNARDDTGSKKGNNWLAGAGFAYTPLDEADRVISVQLGLAAEGQDPDVIDSFDTVSGGWEVFASPTLVWMAAPGVRFFTYVSLPLAQHYDADYQLDRWRAGAGIVYSFAREPHVDTGTSR
jgi:hypothetical protein